MKKTVLAFLLLLAIMLALASCNGANTPSDNYDNDTNDTPVHIHEFGEWGLTLKPTCTEDGIKVRYCSCGEKQTEVVVSLGHTHAEAVIENKIDATYETDGSYTEVVYCSICSEKLSETLHTIPMLKHSPAEAVTENLVNATCYSEGSYDSVVYCSVCNAELSRSKVTIQKTEHSPVTTEENRVEATCSSAGSYDEVVYCSTENCKAQISRTTKVIDTLDHIEAIVKGKAPTCSEEGITDGKYCSVCNTVILAQEIIPTSVHDYVGGACSICKEVPEDVRLDFTLNSNGKSYAVSGIGTYAYTTLVIPATYKGLPVNTIASSAFMGNETLTSVIIPETITYINSDAFASCTSLLRAELHCNDLSPTYVGVIFYGCSSLEYLYLKDLEYVTQNAYGYNLYYPIIGRLFGRSSYTGSVATTMKYHDAEYAVQKDVTYYLPESLKTVCLGGYGFHCYTGGGYVSPFKGCTTIEEIIIEDGIKLVPHQSFSSFTGLKKITIPSSVTSIDGFAFAVCTNLESITLPEGVTTISSNAFAHCSSLVEITLPSTLTKIDSCVFEYSTVQTINYNGTKADFLAIYKYYDWDTNTGDYVINCTDGPLTKEAIKWNYDGQMHTYSFETNCEIVLDSMTSDECISLPVLERSGYVFGGWYINEDLSGSAVASRYYSATDITLYAKWHKLYTCQFETNCEAVLNPLNTYLNATLPLPERSGYYFVGWYESPTFEGSPLDRFPATGDITLYAKWTTSESIYLSFCNGASFARAIPVPVGTTSITLSEESKYFVFIPTETKSYTISTSGASGPDSWGALYDSSLSWLISDDDDGSGNNFSITYELIAGQKYYIRADVYDGSCNCSLIIS